MRITSIAGMLLLGLIAVASLFARPAQPVVAASPPGAPGTPVAIAGEASATVYWGAASGTVTNYQVQASPGGATTAAGTSLSVTMTGLSDGTAYTFTVTADNSGTPGPISAPSNSVMPGASPFKPLTPARILDTRSGSPLGPGDTRTLGVDGLGGLPIGGMSAVWLNVTVTDTTAASFLAVWPAGLPRPATSNLNWTAHKTVPNLVAVALGPGDHVSFYNGTGKADLVVDVFGYVAMPNTNFGGAGQFTAITPHRVLDTRIGLGAPKAQLCAGQVITVQIAGTQGVPSTGVSAVVLNVTATNTVVAPSSVIVFPAGSTHPNTSNLNFVPGQTVANRVVVPLSAGGAVSFFDYVGHLDVIADVNGWFTDSTATPGTGSKFVGMSPYRLLDTRGTGLALTAGNTMPLFVATATAAILNLTVTGPTRASALTVWPDGTPRPGTSDLNWVAGQTVANLVVVKLVGGKIDLGIGSGRTDVIVDVVGWYA